MPAAGQLQPAQSRPPHAPSLPRDTRARPYLLWPDGSRILLESGVTALTASDDAALLDSAFAALATSDGSAMLAEDFGPLGVPRGTHMPSKPRR